MGSAGPRRNWEIRSQLVGLDGYSPVSIMKSRKWTRRLSNDSRGLQGRSPTILSSREELLEFRKSPESYGAPQTAGLRTRLNPVGNRPCDFAGTADFAAFYRR